MKKYITIFILSFFSIAVYAQVGKDSNKIAVQESVSNKIATNSPIPQPAPNGSKTFLPNPDVSANSSPLMTTYEFGLSLGVLFFGLLLILLEVYLIKSKKIGEELLVKFIVITLIITGTLFLITAGYDNDQIAPAIGLFGTVAGYLLGKSINNQTEKDVTKS